MNPLMIILLVITFGAISSLEGSTVERPREELHPLSGALSVGTKDPLLRSYPIPNRGVLELAVPPSWKEAVHQPEGGLPPTIEFVPPSGNSFKLVVTVLWSVKPGLNINEPGYIKETVTAMGRRILHTAVEKELNLLELKQEKSIGYYYFLTDKAPKPGEFLYAAQGAIGVGGLQLAFTLLLNDKESSDRRAALEALLHARHQKR